MSWKAAATYDVRISAAGAMGCLGNLWAGAVSPDFQLSELTSQNLRLLFKKQL